jgi:hypothetical protein
MVSRFQSLRWVAANEDGLLVPNPAAVFCVRLAALTTGSEEIVALLRDGTTPESPPLLAFDVVAGRPDDWPHVPVCAYFRGGLYVTFMGGVPEERMLTVGWDTF